MNYKNTGREYTLADLFELDLKLSVDDVVWHCNETAITVDVIDGYNTPSHHYDWVMLMDCKQLDEYLAKQESEVEWKNGDKCLWNNAEAVFIGKTISNPSIALIEYLKDNHPIISRVYIDSISKPLTEQQKKEQLAKELHDCGNKAYFGDNYPAKEYDWEYADCNVRKLWLAIVDKTGYTGETK